MSLIDSVIKLTITRQTQAVSRVGFGIPLILVEHDVHEDYIRYYTDLTGLAVDFASGTDVYKAAQALLSGDNKPTRFAVGKKDPVDDADYAAALDKIVAVDNDWYAVGLISKAKADILNVAAWIEANKKLFVPTSNDADVITSASDDIASDLMAYTRSGLFYSKNADNQGAYTWLGSYLPYGPGTLTWAYKGLNGVQADTYTTTELSNLESKRANHYVTLGGRDLVREGWTGKEFIDIIRGQDWLVARIQESVFKTLADELKIPYTNKGINLVVSKVQEVLDDAVDAGVLREGARATAKKLEDIDLNSRALRLLTGVSFTGEFAGAIHKIELDGLLTV